MKCTPARPAARLPQMPPPRPGMQPNAHPLHHPKDRSTEARLSVLVHLLLHCYYIVLHITTDSLPLVVLCATKENNARSHSSGLVWPAKMEASEKTPVKCEPARRWSGSPFLPHFHSE